MDEVQQQWHWHGTTLRMNWFAKRSGGHDRKHGRLEEHMLANGVITKGMAQKERYITGYMKNLMKLIFVKKSQNRL